MGCVMPLLSQTDLGMMKRAKARNAKCSKKETSYKVEERSFRKTDQTFSSEHLALLSENEASVHLA